MTSIEQRIRQQNRKHWLFDSDQACIDRRPVLTRNSEKEFPLDIRVV